MTAIINHIQFDSWVSVDCGHEQQLLQFMALGLPAARARRETGSLQQEAQTHHIGIVTAALAVVVKNGNYLSRHEHRNEYIKAHDRKE